MTSQRISYLENCIDVVTVFADEEEAARSGGTLRIFVAAATAAAVGATVLGGISLLTTAAAGVGTVITLMTASGWIEVRTAAVDGAAGAINIAAFEEFRAFMAFFNSFWNSFLIRSVAL